MVLGVSDFILCNLGFVAVKKRPHEVCLHVTHEGNLSSGDI